MKNEAVSNENPIRNYFVSIFPDIQPRYIHHRVIMEPNTDNSVIDVDSGSGMIRPFMAGFNNEFNI